MLPKKAYSKVIQGLKHIKKQWDEDRVENPSQVPYEIDSELRSLIARCAREENANVGGNRNMEILCDRTITYLVEKKIIVRSPYGGVMFPLPEDHAPLPSRDELVQHIRDQMRNKEFFGKG